MYESVTVENMKKRAPEMVGTPASVLTAKRTKEGRGWKEAD